MPMYRALMRHWRKEPPTHRLLAAFVGYKAPRDAADMTDASGGRQLLLDMLSMAQETMKGGGA
jgi:hypothetical protein